MWSACASTRARSPARATCAGFCASQLAARLLGAHCRRSSAACPNRTCAGHQRKGLCARLFTPPSCLLQPCRAPIFKCRALAPEIPACEQTWLPNNWCLEATGATGCSAQRCKAHLSPGDLACVHCRQHQLAYGTALCTAMLQRGLVFSILPALGKGGAVICMQLRCLWDLMGRAVYSRLK